MPSVCFGAISNVHLLSVQWKNTGGLKQKHKNLSPSAKTKPGRDVILHVRP